MKGATYTLEAGRLIVRDGLPVATLHKVEIDDGSGRCTLSPVEADELAHSVVDSLNGRHYAQRFDAGHDTNGNPRRFFLVYNARGETVDAIDEGYKGSAALRSEYPDAIELGTVPTSAAFRRDTLREFRNKGAK